MRAPMTTLKYARALRREMTLPEVILWQALRRRFVNRLRFRRQHPVGTYVLDFYCPSARLAVEVDGLAHDNAARRQRDERRDEWLNARGIKVLRFMASDVLNTERREAVLLAIADAAAPSTAFGGPPPP